MYICFVNVSVDVLIILYAASGDFNVCLLFSTLLQVIFMYFILSCQRHS